MLNQIIVLAVFRLILLMHHLFFTSQRMIVDQAYKLMIWKLVFKLLIK